MDTQRAAARLLGTAALIAAGFAPAAAQLPPRAAPGYEPPPQLAPSQQPGSELPAVIGQLRTVEQALRHAQDRIAQNEPPNLALARTAVDGGQRVLGRLTPLPDGRDAAARRELAEAERELLSEAPTRWNVATQLREAADAVGRLASDLAGTTR